MSVEKWDQRQLCPDGACIGVIDDSGTCTVCGRVAPNWGEERTRGLRDESGPIVTAEKPRDPIEPGAPAAIGRPPDWSHRQLCSDGACIGVIGSDGRCKVCGRAADGSPPEDDHEDDYEDAGEGDEDEDEGVADFEDEDEDEDAAAQDAELLAAATDLAASLPPSDEDAVDRKLCPDGGCIGVIGPDGKCKVCGKEAG